MVAGSQAQWQQLPVFVLMCGTFGRFWFRAATSVVICAKGLVIRHLFL